jgi:hypothetical protein
LGFEGADDIPRKDEILRLIKTNNPSTAAIRAVDPKISVNAISGLRHGDRAAS